MLHPIPTSPSSSSRRTADATCSRASVLPSPGPGHDHGPDHVVWARGDAWPARRVDWSRSRQPDPGGPAGGGQAEMQKPSGRRVKCRVGPRVDYVT